MHISLVLVPIIYYFIYGAKADSSNFAPAGG